MDKDVAAKAVEIVEKMMGAMERLISTQGPAAVDLAIQATRWQAASELASVALALAVTGAVAVWSCRRLRAAVAEFASKIAVWEKDAGAHYATRPSEDSVTTYQVVLSISSALTTCGAAVLIIMGPRLILAVIDPRLALARKVLDRFLP